MSSKITPNDTRKQFVTNGRNIISKKKNLPGDKQDPFEQHTWASILAWTNVNNQSNPLAPKTSIYLPSNNIKQDTMDNWKSKLENAGYGVKINKTHFTISIQ